MAKKMDVGDLIELVLSLEKRVEALEQKPRAGRPPDRINLCVEWLEKLLKKGPVAITYIMRTGEEKGFTSLMIRKAGRKLAIGSDRKTWRLP